jgi:hypothetical protein
MHNVAKIKIKKMVIAMITVPFLTTQFEQSNSTVHGAEGPGGIGLSSKGVLGPKYSGGGGPTGGSAAPDLGVL